MLQDIKSYLEMKPEKLSKKLDELDELLIEGYDNQTNEIRGTLLVVIMIYATYFFVNLKFDL